MANFTTPELQPHQGVVSSGTLDVNPNLVFALQIGSSTGVAPIWELVSPPNGTHIVATTPVVFRVTVTPGATLGAVFVSFVYPSLGVSELAVRVNATVAPYLTATITPITGGLEVSMLRTGGWPDASLLFDGIGFDILGTEADASFAWIVDFTTTVTPPATTPDVIASSGSRDIRIDPVTNRFTLTATGDLAFVGGAESIAQAHRQKLRAFLGEYFLDETQGIDWFGEVLVKNPNLPAVRTLIRSQIEEVPGTRSVDTFNVEFSKGSRSLSINYTATSDTGELITSSFAVGQGA